MILNTYSIASLSLGLFLTSTVTAAPAPSYSISPAPTNATTTSISQGVATPAPKKFTDAAQAYVKKTKASLNTGECTTEKLAVRKSWADLKKAEKQDYLRAVNCLAKKPAKTDKKLAPGAKNRLDDFTYNHINQTNLIHNDALLLPWHRAFLFNFEKALREECSYKSFLPYWDMGAHSSDQTKSPVFDGSETSFGSDGKAVPHKTILAPIPGLVKNFTVPKPAGSGGGCVTSGPFKDLQLSLGPVAVLNGNPKDPFGYLPNPRCLSRDFNQQVSSANLTWTNLTDLVTQPDIKSFRTFLEPVIHLNGHLFIGSEGADPFSTTNDPVFYLLHSQIDRMWAIWQGQDLAARQNAIDGKTTFFGIPTTDAPNEKPRDATLDDVMDLGLNGKIPIKEGMSATSDGRCYIYA